jgi:hypothetical protein
MLLQHTAKYLNKEGKISILVIIHETKRAVGSTAILRTC